MNKFIFLRDKHVLYRVIIADILFIQSCKDYVVINLMSRRFIIHKTMSSLQEKFPDFYRVSRFHIINLEKVDKIEEREIHIGNERIPIGGGHYKDNFYREIKKWKI